MLVHRVNTAGQRIGLLKEKPVNVSKKPGGVICGTPQHDPIETAHFITGLLKCGQAPIQDYVEMRKVCFQLMHPGIIERRNFPVFLRAEAFKPSLAGVDYECIATCCRDCFNKAIKALDFVLVVNADATFHCDRYFDGGTHRCNTIRHELWFCHEAGAESSFLNPVRRAANVQIDFAIAEILTNSGGIRQQAGIAAAELEGHRLLKRIKAQEALAVAMANGLGGHHFGIKQGVPGQVAVKDAAMPVGPIHHGRHGKYFFLVFQCITIIFQTNTMLLCALFY